MLDPPRKIWQFVWSHGPLFGTPRQNFFGVMGLFFGPLGKTFLESWFPDFQTPPPKKLSDPNLTPLPTHPGIKYVARALAATRILVPESV